MGAPLRCGLPTEPRTTPRIRLAERLRIGDDFVACPFAFQVSFEPF